MFILQLNREGIKSTIDDSYRTCHKVRSITDQVVNGTIQSSGSPKRPNGV